MKFNSISSLTAHY